MSAGGGMENAELGIAIQDGIAADARMRGKDGLGAQQKWASGILSDRIWAYALMALIVGTPIVWMMGSEMVRGVWIGVLCVSALAVVLILQSRSQNIDAIRKQQLAEHRAKTGEKT